MLEKITDEELEKVNGGLSSEDGVNFLNEIGGVSIPKEQFCVIVEDFLKEYAHHWFN